MLFRSGGGGGGGGGGGAFRPAGGSPLKPAGGGGGGGGGGAPFPPAGPGGGDGPDIFFFETKNTNAFVEKNVIFEELLGQHRNEYPQDKHQHQRVKTAGGRMHFSLASLSSSFLDVIHPSRPRAGAPPWAGSNDRIQRY